MNRIDKKDINASLMVLEGPLGILQFSLLEKAGRWETLCENDFF